MSAIDGEIKKGRKFEQVLEGARDVFLNDGFEGASVDDIARAARVSKATLYSYFPDKRLLFLEVAKTECNRQAERALSAIDPSAPVADVLRATADHLVSFSLSEFGQNVFRICVAESDRFPELGRAFYDSGPAHVHSHITAFLAQAVARGDLVIEDIPLAADQFSELCKADLFLRMVFGMNRRFTSEEINRVIDGAVATFMARYGA
ncbi:MULTISPECIES: TetR/AcrR family transcriptional regulator [Actibacterium]|uniref:AcrR family transcriptional regulator n=1 Tax=Actibacterium naphthalenivorans TaxID=1614693 RepID=A0A840C6A0_9RHOB|nr:MULTISPECIES: TetR/AcrR family transcriptional regulator [Actibacterium]ALG89055.1 TetR family transcriptional regulator [Actibacterium sp. EMB200-NS6]MBB4021384.1 AcrR family transcriptional regulator [Actibacterium naphthalenivorans]